MVCRQGFGFGKTPTGKVVLIHAGAVQGAEVLKIGTDARVEVVNDDARAQEGGIEPDGPDDKTRGKRRRTRRANKVTQQVRRAAALTAELAAQSEKKTAAVCDQPPSLDEFVGHIETPNMEAGGSHPQATMMPGPHTRVLARVTTRPKPLVPPRQIASLQTEEFLLKPECSVALDFDQPHELRRHVREVRT